jgi:hypothetical protein
MEAPRHLHDCDDCLFLGHDEGVDFYLHRRLEPSVFVTLVARHSGDGPDYQSHSGSRVYLTRIAASSPSGHWLRTAVGLADRSGHFPESPLVHAGTVSDRTVEPSGRRQDSPGVVNLWFWPDRSLWFATFNEPFSTSEGQGWELARCLVEQDGRETPEEALAQVMPSAQSSSRRTGIPCGSRISSMRTRPQRSMRWRTGSRPRTAGTTRASVWSRMRSPGTRSGSWGHERLRSIRDREIVRRRSCPGVCLGIPERSTRDAHRGDGSPQARRSRAYGLLDGSRRAGTRASGS